MVINGIEVYWCVHCECVDVPKSRKYKGHIYYSCTSCKAGEFDLWAWVGDYIPGAYYHQYDDYSMECLERGKEAIEALEDLENLDQDT